MSNKRYIVGFKIEAIKRLQPGSNRSQKTHNLVCSMSRRGNCYDNAVAASFFLLLKREMIKCKTYKDRHETRQDIFNHIKTFYNPVRRHGYNDDLSPIEFKKPHQRNQGTIHKTSGDPVIMITVS